jgi:hypothetical protein
MPEGIRPEARYAAALVILALYPACVNYSLAFLLFIPGIAAVIFLWLLNDYVRLLPAMLLTLAATFLTFGYIVGLFLLIGFAVPALMEAFMLKRSLGLAKSGLVAMIAPITALALSYPIMREATDIVSAELNRMVADPKFAGLYSAADHELLVEYVKWMTGTIELLLPAILLSFVATIIFAGGILGILLARRKGIFVFGIRNVAMWKLPEWPLFPLAVAAILVLTQATAATVIGWNVLFLLFLLYSLAGLSLAEYLMRHWKLSTPLKILFYVALFLTQVVAAVVLPLAALFDSHFDFRRVRAKRLG